MNNFFCILMLSVGLLSAANALAGEVKPPLTPADTLAAFEQQAAVVKGQMQPHGRYRYLDRNERAQVEQRLASMNALFKRYGSVGAMPQDARIALFNAQEKANSILTHNDANRLVCHRVALMGSNIPRTECLTYGQIMRERENTRWSMQNLDQTGRANDATKLGQSSGGG
ncbi:hypothetical protein [Metallibacterium sp.]|jgi:hypothetical protein|uniref:hypothetical protein n=1 Tax=Metallibacterium sp. TaxID=2940281 RepID=UPI0026160C6F|nr:hypothetical protein [Metallibacterium sp.]